MGVDGVGKIRGAEPTPAAVKPPRPEVEVESTGVFHADARAVGNGWKLVNCDDSACFELK